MRNRDDVHVLREAVVKLRQIDFQEQNVRKFTLSYFSELWMDASARRAIFPEVLNNNERRFTFEYLFDVVALLLVLDAFVDGI